MRRLITLWVFWLAFTMSLGCTIRVKHEVRPGVMTCRPTLFGGYACKFESKDDKK